MDEFSKFSVYLDGKRCNLITSCKLELEPYAVHETKIPHGKFEFSTTMTMEQGAWDKLSNLSTMDTFDPLRIGEYSVRVKGTGWPLVETLGRWFSEFLFGFLMPCRVERIQAENSDGSAWVLVGIYNRFPEGKNEVF